jgi:hypothetical protein
MNHIHIYIYMYIPMLIIQTKIEPCLIQYTIKEEYVLKLGNTTSVPISHHRVIIVRKLYTYATVKAAQRSQVF